jgi:hypothetical protein
MPNEKATVVNEETTLVNDYTTVVNEKQHALRSSGSGMFPTSLDLNPDKLNR